MKTKNIITTIAIVSLLIFSSLLNSNNVVYAGGKGLKVIVTVENVPSNVVGQEAGITVATENDRTVHKAVIIPDSSNFFTQLQYDSGEVAVGESFRACVFINSQLNECANGINGEDKAPEHVTIFLPNTGNGNNQGGDQSSSSSSAANDGSAASSSSSSSKSCLAFC